MQREGHLQTGQLPMGGEQPQKNPIPGTYEKQHSKQKNEIKKRKTKNKIKIKMKKWDKTYIHIYNAHCKQGCHGSGGVEQ